MIIFTNEQRPNNITRYQNENRYKTYHANTKEDAREIIEKVKNKGFIVTAIKSNLGNAISI